MQFADEGKKKDLVQKPKEYSVKFSFPEPTKLPPPVLGLHSMIMDFSFRLFFFWKCWVERERE